MNASFDLANRLQRIANSSRVQGDVFQSISIASLSSSATSNIPASLKTTSSRTTSKSAKTNPQQALQSPASLLDSNHRGSSENRFMSRHSSWRYCLGSSRTTYPPPLGPSTPNSSPTTMSALSTALATNAPARREL